MLSVIYKRFVHLAPTFNIPCLMTPSYRSPVENFHVVDFCRWYTLHPPLIASDGAMYPPVECSCAFSSTKMKIPYHCPHNRGCSSASRVLIGDSRTSSDDCGPSVMPCITRASAGICCHVGCHVVLPCSRSLACSAIDRRWSFFGLNIAISESRRFWSRAAFEERQYSSFSKLENALVLY